MFGRYSRASNTPHRRPSATRRLSPAIAFSVALAAVTLALAGVAYPVGASNGLPNHDVVFGGGKFDFPQTTLARNFSLTARRDGERGEGTLQYQRFTVEVTCARVEGNAAVIGGIVRSSPDNAANGLPAAMHFVDNGVPVGQNVGGDTVSPLMIPGPDEDLGGLPSTCPAVEASLATQLLYAGDVTVHAGQ